jgi:MFS family permease
LLGIGGIFAGVAGGLITQYYDTHWIFYIFGFMGFLISLSGFLMSADIEADQMLVINLTLKQRVKKNFSDIKTGFKVKELWKSFIFFFLLGCLVPTF